MSTIYAFYLLTLDVAFAGMRALALAESKWMCALVTSLSLVPMVGDFVGDPYPST